MSEGLWDNSAFLDGRGINTLAGADSVAPFGGAAFHDIRVYAEPAGSGNDAIASASAQEPAPAAM